MRIFILLFVLCLAAMATDAADFGKPGHPDKPLPYLQANQELSYCSILVVNAENQSVWVQGWYCAPLTFMLRGVPAEMAAPYYDRVIDVKVLPKPGPMPDSIRTTVNNMVTIHNRDWAHKEKARATTAP